MADVMWQTVGGEWKSGTLAGAYECDSDTARVFEAGSEIEVAVAFAELLPCERPRAARSIELMAAAYIDAKRDMRKAGLL